MLHINNIIREFKIKKEKIKIIKNKKEKIKYILLLYIYFILFYVFLRLIGNLFKTKL